MTNIKGGTTTGGRSKTFVGTSATALHTQIWTALIALLVLKYLQLRSTFGWSLSNLVALLHFQLSNPLETSGPG